MKSLFFPEKRTQSFLSYVAEVMGTKLDELDDVQVFEALHRTEVTDFTDRKAVPTTLEVQSRKNELSSFCKAILAALFFHGHYHWKDPSILAQAQSENFHSKIGTCELVNKYIYAVAETRGRGGLASPFEIWQSPSTFWHGIKLV